MPDLRPLLVLTVLLSCHKPDPRVAEARQELDSFARSLRDFRDQKGHWPANLVEGVGASCLGEHHDCVTDQGKRRDPWGSVYEYDQSLKSALLRSPGPDKQLGTRDDLEVFVPAKGERKP
jgi:hypothetical protein